MSDGTSARALFGQAIQQRKAGDAAEYERLLRRTIAEHPRDNWAGCALGHLGGLQFEQAKYDDAIDSFERVLRDFPRAQYGDGKLVASVAAYYLAFSYRRKGENERAAKAFKEAVRKYPEARTGDGKRFADIFENEGGAQKTTASGRAEEAQKLFAEALRQRQAGNLEGYEQALKETVARYPKASAAACALGHLGLLKMNQKKYDDAIAAYRKVVNEFPTARYGNGKLVASYAAYCVATCYYRKGEKNQAMEAFELAVEKYPNACTGDAGTGKRLSDIFLEMIERDAQKEAAADGPAVQE